MLQSKPSPSTVYRIECNLTIDRLYARKEVLDWKLVDCANRLVDDILKTLPFVHLRLGCPMLRTETDRQLARRLLVESIERRDWEEPNTLHLHVCLYIDRDRLEYIISKCIGQHTQMFFIPYPLGGGYTVETTDPAVKRAAEFVWYCFDNYRRKRQSRRPCYPCGQVC